MSLSCPYCLSKNNPSASRNSIVCAGRFRRSSDHKLRQRFLCRPCNRTFSESTRELCYRQRKRHINSHIFQYLVSGISQRRLALLLRVDRKTIVRKFHFLGVISYFVLQEELKAFPPAKEIQFDDLETFEHSKLKPLSVTMAVEAGSRRILDFRVSRMPAKGLLVERSLKKYGPRFDERKKNRVSLLSDIVPYIAPNAVIRSDENPHYPVDVRRFFPSAVHKVYKGRRGCVVGQGELKAGGFDPLFSLNHTFAMNRASINRLFRRTWNTTKKLECLSLHLAMYALFHNKVLIVPGVRAV